MHFFFLFVYFEYLKFTPEWYFWDTYHIFKIRKKLKRKKASLSSFWALKRRDSTSLYRLYEMWYVQLHVLNLVCTLMKPDLVLHFLKTFRNKFRAFATRGLGVTKKHKSLCMTFIKHGLLPSSIYRAHLSNYTGEVAQVCLLQPVICMTDTFSRRSYIWPIASCCCCFWSAEWCIEASGMASTDVRGVYMT